MYLVLPYTRNLAMVAGIMRARHDDQVEASSPADAARR
jgi:hypothetical protein